MMMYAQACLRRVPEMMGGQNPSLSRDETNRLLQLNKCSSNLTISTIK